LNSLSQLKQAQTSQSPCPGQIWSQTIN
jgi:hypothetical protein